MTLIFKKKKIFDYGTENEPTPGTIRAFATIHKNRGKNEWNNNRYITHSPSDSYIRTLPITMVPILRDTGTLVVGGVLSCPDPDKWLLPVEIVG